jgi:DNA gyrase subunit B
MLLIERGHIYIAQPPLYKAKLGKDERYLKDEFELNEFMLRQALVDAALHPAAKREPITGDTLAELAKAYLLAEAVIERVSRWIDRDVLVAMLRGVQIDLGRRDSAQTSAEAAPAPPPGAGAFRRTSTQDGATRCASGLRHGNMRVTTIDSEFVHSRDYAQIRQCRGDAAAWSASAPMCSAAKEVSGQGFRRGDALAARRGAEVERACSATRDWAK